MEIIVYRNGAETVEEGFSREHLSELLADKSNVVWVDLQGESEECVEEAKDVLLNICGFHPLTVEDCVETRNQPKVEPFEDYLYFIIHGIKPGETNPANFVTKELDGYLGENFVVTYHTQRFRSIKSVKQKIRASPYICRRGAAYLLHSILDEIVDLYAPIIDDFDSTINTLEERVFSSKADAAVLSNVMDVRRSVARLKRISSRQLEVIYRMAHGEFEQIPKDVLPFFRDVHDHLQRVSDLAESYRDLVAGLFDIHFAITTNKANDVMKTLAVVSAIILPLSLIAGIYGMNFENMPELKSPIGYFATLGGMVLLTAVLLFYFWRRGWIFQGSEVEIAMPKSGPDFNDEAEEVADRSEKLSPDRSGAIT